MAEMIQRFVQDFFLSVLGLIGGSCAIYAIVAITRCFLVRVKSVGLALLFSVAAAVMFGGAKTNELLQSFFPFVPQVQQIPLMPTSLSTNGVPVIAATSPRASATMPFRAEKWNVRGAWNDSFRYAFDDGWEFPFGTGHIDRVEVCSQGHVIPRYGSTDVIASVGVPLEIVNPTTSFGCGSTDRNSYIFSWTNAVVGRVLHEEVAGAETIDAAIELFRNGDVGITTNGVTELIPRVLPFPHDGFGQDEEWIAANFTNATEILAVGYPQWVDAQVGENLTNGLYKFTVTVPDVPPETIQLVVGDYSVAVTNSGDYVFLLEKGTYYEVDFSYLPYGVAYAWSDGMEDVLPHMPLRGAINGPAYTVRLVSTGDGGHDAEFTAPAQGASGSIVWRPWLSIAPDDVTDPAFPVLLSADVFDIPEGRGASVTWEANGNVLATGENFLWDGNEDDIDVINVTATIHDVMLHGVVRVVRHVRTSGISISGGGLIIVEDAYTNAPGEVVSASSTSTVIDFSWALSEDGELAISNSCEGVVFSSSQDETVAMPHLWHGYADEEGALSLIASYSGDSVPTGSVGEVIFTFTPASGSPAMVCSVPFRVVRVRVEAEADWPSNKVRHVFGPKERFTITTTPHVPLHVESNSYVIVSNDATTVISPDRSGPFTVYLSHGSRFYGLSFNCIAPTLLKGGNPRELNDYELVQHDVPQFNVGDAGVAMHIDTWLEPLFVSFQNVSIYEGYAPPIKRNGWYQDTNAFTIAWLEHGDAAGAFSNYAEVSSTENFIDGGDVVAALMIPTNTYYNGSYQLSIPLYWFAKDGFVTNRLPDNVQCIQVYSNGTMRISKNGITWERCLDGTSHKVEE